MQFYVSVRVSINQCTIHLVLLIAQPLRIIYERISSPYLSVMLSLHIICDTGCVDASEVCLYANYGSTEEEYFLWKHYALRTGAETVTWSSDK